GAHLRQRRRRSATRAPQVHLDWFDVKRSSAGGAAGAGVLLLDARGEAGAVVAVGLAVATAHRVVVGGADRRGGLADAGEVGAATGAHRGDVAVQAGGAAEATLAAARRARSHRGRLDPTIEL